MKRTWMIVSGSGDVMDRNEEWEFKTRDAAESYALECCEEGGENEFTIFEAVSYVEQPPAILKKIK